MSGALRSGRGVRAKSPGGPDVLELQPIELPQPGPHQVLIRVAAAGVNRPDLFQRMGLYPPPPGASDVLGLEVSGHVAEAGAEAGFREGDPVCALLAGGGYADLALADAGSVLPAPPGIDLVQAAGLPEAVFTVWGNAFERARLAPGETLLVHGGASGIGTTAIQMAAAHGARVLATAGTPEKVALCERLGAARGIDYRTERFLDVVKSLGGADVVLDMVGAAYLADNLAALKDDGRLVMIAQLKGSRGEVDLMDVMRRRLTITGSTLRPRPPEVKRRFRDAILAQVWPWVAEGKVRPVVDSVFPLHSAADAHRRMESGEHAGKILLAVTIEDLLGMPGMEDIEIEFPKSRELPREIDLS
jgi:putative PIG3 family NAD(P)H quinone oxidoreductase